mgnify:CR=1 FL=1
MNVKKAGNTQPRFLFAKGIAFLILSSHSASIKNPKKSGILKINATKTTPLKTSFEAYFSGITFNRMSTIVKG